MGLSQSSLKTKMILINGMMAAFMLLVGGIGLYALHTVSETYKHITTVNLPNTRVAGRMETESTNVSRLYLRLVAPGITKEDFEKNKTQLEEAIADYEESDKHYNELPFMPGEKEIYDAQNAVWKEFVPAIRKFVSLYSSDEEGSKQKALEILNTDLIKFRRAHSQGIEKLIEFQRIEGEHWSTLAESEQVRFTWIASTVVALGLLISMVVGILFSSSLSKSLQEMANRISSGAEEVAAATRQISNSSEELSAAATEQAASLEETSASIEEMTAMIAKNSENASNSRQSAQAGSDTASEGKKIVGDMIESMSRIGKSNDDIMSQIESSNQQLGKIVEVIQSIGEKTKVINDIVFQTKLLSFNASVEAARAGEHGKGFAVVAEEVGNLATMSGKAAAEIASMLGTSIQQVESTVNDTKTKVEQLMAAGKTEVTHGAEIAQKCGEILEQIVQRVSGINQMAGEIATASGEQSTGIAEINKAMSQLDQVTQQNATASQQTASATEELSAQAEMLRSMVAQLMQVVLGANAATLGTQTTHVASSTKPKRNSKGNGSAGGAFGKSAEVIQFKPRSEEKSLPVAVADSGPRVKLKKAAGGDTIPPASDDPRFVDV